MKRFGLLLVCAVLAACGGDDSGGSELSERDALSSECPNGGLVFAIDGQEQAPICNGEDGAQGERGLAGTAGPKGDPGATGATGARGATGISGTNAGSSNVVATTVLCQSSDPVASVSLSAYIWVLDPAADPNDNIGICEISEVSPSRRSQTSPIIGTRCVVASDTYGGIVTIDFATNPPVLGGAATGTMSCS